MSPILGVSVRAGAVHAVLADSGRIWWAGSAAYQSVADLADVIARLAGESGKRTRGVRVVLERDLVQLRTLVPAPPIKPGAVARYVALEAPRLFRKNGAPLATDAQLVRLSKTERALWAGAAAEPLVQAIADGCAQAGLELEALGPAAEVLPWALSVRAEDAAYVFPNGSTSEAVEIRGGRTWRSRAVRGGEHPCPEWAQPLAGLGENARRFAAAYGATQVRSRLLLLPAGSRAALACRALTSVRRVLMAGVATWALAAGVYSARVLVSSRHVENELAALGPRVDSALVLRRDLDAATRALGMIEVARRQRSRSLALLGELTAALDDSTVIIALRVSPDSTVRLAGYAPAASRVLAQLERVRALRNSRLEAPTTRETIAWGGGTRDWDRFAILARLEPGP